MIEKARQLLKKYYGYDDFRKGQENTIESILNKKDTLAIMPTGAGKSICYQIPALLFEGITIVISPLISLMKDQVDSLNNSGIKATFINSSLSQLELEERILMARNGEYKLLYVAPERLQSQSFCNVLNTLEVSLIAVDEAHCVSQWGHDFRTSYRTISPLIDSLSTRPVVAAFTATATENVKEDILKLLNLKEPNIFVTGFDRANLFFSVVKGQDKKEFLLNYIEDNRDRVGIVYCSTRKEVDKTFELLSKRGYKVGRYHAGLSDEIRKENQEKFIYDDINIIVATNAFGMGIDKSNVRYVIHYNMPQNMEAYYQEAGRAGRDGEESDCILLFSEQDVLLQKFLIEQSIQSPIRRTNLYGKLQEMSDYCHTSKCLRKYILEYFGEQDVKDRCENCSNCKDESELTDITIEAQKIFSCILRMKERFGTTMIADVLKGSKNKKVLAQGFEKLSTYGIMREYTVKEIKDIINGLIADQYLKLTEQQFPVVRLKEKSVDVLKGKEKVMQKVLKRQAKVKEDNSLFEVLRELRKEISTREKVPPYIIFSDGTLHEMSKFMPINDDEMINIKGVGESKVQKYGEEFINAIMGYIKENNISIENRVVIEEDKKSKKNDVPSHVVTFNLYKEGKSLEEICKERDIKIITVQDHLIRCKLEGLDVNLDDFIPEKYEDMILKVIEKIGAEKLKPIKDELPSEVDYLAIKAVICKYKVS